MSEIRHAKEFAKLWNCKEDAILHGDQTTLDIPGRQNILIEQMIDACIILHIYEQMKMGMDFEEVKYLFPKNYTAQDFVKLQIKSRDTQPNTATQSQTEVLETLIKMQREPSQYQKLNSHTDIVSNKNLIKYQNDLQIYYNKDAIWKDSLEKISHDGSRVPARPDMPEDPRISELKKRTSTTVSIYNSGGKDPYSIELKLKRNEKKDIRIKDIRDINRLTILPTRPQYTKDFIAIMKLQHPEKNVMFSKIPRFFAEEPEMRDNGYYNQKLYLALDQNKKNELTNGNQATISEIKILPTQMLVGDKLTSPLNDVERVICLFLQSINDGKIEGNEQDYSIFNSTIQDLSNHKKKYFDKINQIYETNYDWPVFSEQGIYDKQSCIEFQNNILNLQKKIHAESIILENKDWQKQYVKTALTQQLAIDKKTAIKIHKKTDADLTRPDESLASGWLKRICEKAGFDLIKLKKEVKDEYELKNIQKKR